MTYWLQATLGKPTRCSPKPSCYYWNLHLQLCKDSCRNVPEMFCLVHAPATEVAFRLHIKANRKNTSSATTQVQKYIENICACAFSWGIWDALELWTGISKLTCRTNVCHFSSMLKIHSSPSCSWYNSTSPTPATRCPDTAHTHAAPLQHNSGNLQPAAKMKPLWLWCLCVSHMADLQCPRKLYKRLCCLPGRKDGDTCLRV